MIVIHILTKDSSQANEIAEYLVAKKLMLNAITTDKVMVTRSGSDGKIKNETNFLLMGQTKALLFNTIDEKLRSKYGKEMPALYSVPIVNMDWEQANELVTKTVRV